MRWREAGWYIAWVNFNLRSFSPLPLDFACFLSGFVGKP